ncbi:hypothetical protein ACWC4J_20830 [Streptomyces sp. NPDC001356]
MKIKEEGDGWDSPTWDWEVRSGGEVIASGVSGLRFMAVKAAKRAIRLHAKGKVDTAGSEFTIWK